jgi:hypothetical protein
MINTQKMIDIKIQDDLVNFYKDDSESAIYTIRKVELAQIRKDANGDLSEWIEHLILKSWIEADALYALAVMIQNEFPENTINWEQTFFPVEKRQYLNHVKETKKLFSNEKSEVNFKSLMENIQTGIEEQNDYVNGEVSKIVNINLQKVGLK